MDDGEAALGLRPVTRGDAQDLFGLLTLCFADYPGCYTDPHDDLKDLLEPADKYAAPGGFFALEDERGRICACIALAFPAPGVAELHRVYVRPDRHRRGLGRRMTEAMEARARAAGATRMVLYSDTRFTAAHAMYERLGFIRIGGERAVGDISGSIEYCFEKALA